MNILVGFITVPDLDMLVDQDWVVDDKLRIDTGFLKPTLNIYDESALEMALLLADASLRVNVPINLEAMTIAGPGAKPILKTLNALKFHRVVWVDSHADFRFRPRAVASILTQYIHKQAPQDVLMLGRQSSIGENAKTHLLAAEMLGWPCITHVTGVELVDGYHLMVMSQVDDGLLRQRVRTPCVLSVGDVPNTYMRVPTLKDRVRYGQRPLEVLSMEEFQLPDETEALVDLEVITHARPGILIEGETPEKKARELYEMHLKKRLRKQ
jgi:electron transfer flavoprotein beta subunit